MKHTIQIPAYTSNQSHTIDSIVEWMDSQGWQSKYSFTYTVCIWTEHEEVEQLTITLDTLDHLQFVLVWQAVLDREFMPGDIVCAV